MDMAAMEINDTISQKAINYKKSVAGKFMLVEESKLSARIAGEDFCVTRKIDGHLQVLFYENGAVAMVNSSGKQKAKSLKCLDEFAAKVSAAGLKSAVFAAELYVPNEGGRPRCSDVISALADDAKKDNLSLAVFDVVELDAEAFAVAHYKEVHAKISQIFGGAGELCHPVELRKASSVEEVKDIYAEWVTEQGAEGLVVHNETKVVFKVKPRHTIDAVAIGYTMTDDHVRDILFAVIREDGAFQMFGGGINGITIEQRTELAQRFAQKHVDTEYILADSRGIAFQLVKPEIVMELSVIELVHQGNDGKVKTNPLLRFDPEKGWLMEGMTPGVSAHSITITCERTDKQAIAEHVRLAQITDLCPFTEAEEAAPVKRESSTLLARRVFKKVSGTKVMIHKFLIWKTNKEDSGRYPAFVFYHTDFSSGRKELIKRDMAFSSDEQQIRDIMEAEIADNIKKGWTEVL
jgi:hypothetical protein